MRFGERHDPPQRAIVDDATACEILARGLWENACERIAFRGIGSAHACARRTHMDASARATRLDAQRQQTREAFLHEHTVARVHDPGMQRGVSAADTRVSGERQFLARREDSHAIVGAWVGRWQQERGLGQVHPGGEALHRDRIHATGIEYDGQRIAVAERIGEYIELQKAPWSHAELLTAARHDRRKTISRQ